MTFLNLAENGKMDKNIWWKTANCRKTFGGVSKINYLCLKNLDHGRRWGTPPVSGGESAGAVMAFSAFCFLLSVFCFLLLRYQFCVFFVTCTLQICKKSVPLPTLSIRSEHVNTTCKYVGNLIQNAPVSVGAHGRTCAPFPDGRDKLA